MQAQNNKTDLFIAKNIATGAKTGNTISKLSDLTDGEILMINSAAVVVDDANASTTRIRFVARKGLRMDYSPYFNLADVVSYKIEGAAVPKYQVDFVGWNGSSGQLDISASTGYTINADIIPGQSSTDFVKRSILSAMYQTPSSGQTELLAAQGLVKSFVKSLDRWDTIKDSIKAGVTASGTVAAFTNAVGDGTDALFRFTKGSKTVESLDEDGVATILCDIADGQLITVPSESGRKWAVTMTVDDCIIYIGDTLYTVADGGTAAQNAAVAIALINAGTQAYAYVDGDDCVITLKEDTVATVTGYDVDNNVPLVSTIVSTYGDSTPTVYECAATVANSATFTLTEPFEGETCIVPQAEGDTSTYAVGILTQAATGYCGVKLYAMPQAYVQGFIPSAEVSFSTMADSFGVSTSVTNSTAAFPGIGTSKSTGTYEAELQYNTGGNYRGRADAAPSNLATVTNSMYNMCTLVVEPETNTLTSSVKSRFTIMIADEIHPSDTASNQMGETATGIVDGLDAFTALALSDQISYLNDGADL